MLGGAWQAATCIVGVGLLVTVSPLAASAGPFAEGTNASGTIAAYPVPALASR